MEQNSLISTLEADGCGEVKWTINNWKDTHKVVVAAEASCHVDVGNPKIRLRFFLRPKEKLVTVNYDGSSSQRLNKWYSLCAEVQTQVDQNAAIKVTATAAVKKSFTRDGTITLNKSKGKVVEVIDPFLHFESRSVGEYGQLGDPEKSALIAGHLVTDLTITIKAELFHLLESNNTVASVETAVGESLLAEPKESLISDLKNMIVANL